MARWLIADIAEAALHADGVAEGRELLTQVEATAGARPAVWIELNLRHARALLARGEAGAQQCFDDALGADLGSWPFQRARLQLAYGEWLRRQRRIADSRAPLRARPRTPSTRWVACRGASALDASSVRPGSRAGVAIRRPAIS